MDGGARNPNWIRAIDVETLERKGRAILRHEGRQIALFATPEGVWACNNRCPHEGYPLSEGTRAGSGSGCVSPAIGITGSSIWRPAPISIVGRPCASIP